MVAHPRAPPLLRDGNVVLRWAFPVARVPPVTRTPSKGFPALSRSCRPEAKKGHLPQASRGSDADRWISHYARGGRDAHWDGALAQPEDGFALRHTGAEQLQNSLMPLICFQRSTNASQWARCASLSGSPSGACNHT